jgi:hypothetical protein
MGGKCINRSVQGTELLTFLHSLALTFLLLPLLPPLPQIMSPKGSNVSRHASSMPKRV